ncbi:MAG: hypothetical protein DRJ42_16055 [Deltaproteobacteria bacterium]|nr:MAG: hypothetical protein DRJ42_16055 [Deltaproteobacteria bacterium]
MSPPSQAAVLGQTAPAGTARTAATRATTAVGAEGAVRLHTWDQLRIFAALDIVGLHLTGEHALYGFGLPLFLMVSVALAVSRPAPQPTATFLRRRTERVLIPWVAWALTFVFLRAYFTWTTGNEPFGWAEWRMLFYGPRVHLWFLPAIVVAALAAHLLHRATQHLPPLASALPALFAGVALLEVAPHVEFGYPFDQWCFTLPAVGIGYALGRAISMERHDLGRLRLLVTAGYALFGVLVGVLMVGDPNISPFVLRYVGGVSLLVGALWLPNRLDRFTRHLAPLMLGVYILHPAVWGIFIRPIQNLLGLGAVDWLRVAITFPLAIFLVWLIRQSRLRRFV